MIYVFLILAIIAVAALVVIARPSLKKNTALGVQGVESLAIPAPIQKQLDALSARLDHITSLLVELADKNGEAKPERTPSPVKGSPRTGKRTAALPATGATKSGKRKSAKKAPESSPEIKDSADPGSSGLQP